MRTIRNCGTGTVFSVRLYANSGLERDPHRAASGNGSQLCKNFARAMFVFAFYIEMYNITPALTQNRSLPHMPHGCSRHAVRLERQTMEAFHGIQHVVGFDSCATACVAAGSHALHVRI